MKKAITILIVCMSFLAKADSWTQKAMFAGTGIDYPFTFSIGNMGYIGTGEGSFGAYADLWQYDPAVNAWTQKSNFPGTSRGDASCFVIGTNAYVVGGCYLTYYADLWEYNSILDSWSQKATLPASARCDAAAFTLCGKGYFGT